MHIHCEFISYQFLWVKGSFEVSWECLCACARGYVLESTRIHLWYGGTCNCTHSSMTLITYVDNVDICCVCRYINHVYYIYVKFICTYPFFNSKNSFVHCRNNIGNEDGTFTELLLEACGMEWLEM